MTRIDIEGRLRFAFDNTWSAVKWDEEQSYLKGLGAGCPAHDAKAVDILATLNLSTVHLIEVKDPRGHAIEYRDARTVEQLAKLVAEKVRDTLAGILYARGRIDAPHLLRHLKAKYHDRTARIWVVFWYESPVLDPVLAMTLKGLLEAQLMWLRPKVVVCKRNLGDSFPGLTVSSLQGAPT